MSDLESLRAHREQILATAQRHGVGNVRIFGSVARGTATTASDVDLLVDRVGPTSPWFPAGLILDLEAIVGRRVEVVTPQALHASLKDRVFREAVPL